MFNVLERISIIILADKKKTQITVENHLMLMNLIQKIKNLKAKMDVEEKGLEALG